MADVSRPRAAPDATGPRADRGQLFLIGALSLAVLFVGLALLLNTAIFTENLATRNTDPGTDPSISYRTAVEEAVTGIMIRENANGTDPTPPEKVAYFESGVEAWGDGAGLHAARRARVASITVDAEAGTRFEQTNDTFAFTNRSNSPNWNLGQRSAVRDARLTVREDSLPETNSSNARGITGGIVPFAVVFDTVDNGDYYVYVYDDAAQSGDDVTILVSDGLSTDSCTHTGPAAAIDFDNESINGTACPAFDLLDVGEDVDDEEVQLRFERGDRAAGTYAIKVFSGGDISNNVYDNEVDNDGKSFVTAIVYEADVTVTYESTDVYYQTTIRIAPEEVR